MKNHSAQPLDGRLALAASFVPAGSVICDVGTDHAYLPIWLIQNGVCPRALACDINEGPLQSARTHARAAGCADKITFYRADGLNGIDLAAEGVQTVLICGMGGELIARIWTECAYSRTRGVRAILQPMSSAEDLRTSLAERGYCIEDERLAEAAGRIYSCLCVTYDGVPRQLTPAEKVLGAAHIRRGCAGEALFAAYLRREIAAAEKKLRGRTAGGLDTAQERALLCELYEIAKKENISQ